MSRPDEPSAAEIKALLQERIYDLIRQLAPGGKEKGGKYVAPNPTRNDRNPGSFVIWTKSPAIGAWKEFAETKAGGKAMGGDIIDLIAYCRGCGHKGAFDFARSYLGISGMKPEDIRRRADAMKTKREQDEAAALERLMRARRRMWELWNASAPLRGSLAQAYLLSRGVDLARIPNLSPDLRFAARAPYWLERKTLQNGRQVTPEFPAMIAALRNGAGEFIAAHLTFLDPSGEGKAPVAKAKLMYPAFNGERVAAAVNLGASGLSLREAEEAGLREFVCVTEGIENALALAQAEPGDRVNAATSLSALGNVPDSSVYQGFLVAIENDLKASASAAAERALLALAERTGKPVAPLLALAGNDLNDTLKIGAMAGTGDNDEIDF